MRTEFDQSFWTRNSHSAVALSQASHHHIHLHRKWSFKTSSLATLILVSHHKSLSLLRNPLGIEMRLLSKLLAPAVLLQPEEQISLRHPSGVAPARAQCQIQ